MNRAQKGKARADRPSLDIETLTDNTNGSTSHGENRATRSALASISTNTPEASQTPFHSARKQSKEWQTASAKPKRSTKQKDKARKHRSYEAEAEDYMLNLIPINVIIGTIEYAHKLRATSDYDPTAYAKEFGNREQLFNVSKRLWEYPIQESEVWRVEDARFGVGDLRVIFDDDGFFVGFTKKIDRNRNENTVRRVRHHFEEELTQWNLQRRKALSRPRADTAGKWRD